MRILISAQSSASSVIRGIASDAANAAKSLALMAGIGILVVGAALAYSVVQAANFQQGLNRLVTGAGDTTDNMTKMGQSILGISVATGVLTDKLLPAMYLILSANQRGAQSLDTLSAAAKGAQIEQANLSDVTKALTTLQTNWGIHTYTASQYMNGLIVAVSQGKLTLEELSSKMAPILPIAAQMGISFKDVASAMAVQTNAGLDAAKAATGLQAIFVNIENPTSKASKAMIKFGVDSVAVANEMKTSLPGALQMLIDAALKVGPIGSVAFNRAMADMIGGGTRTAKSIDALTQHMGDWVKGTAAIGNAMKGSKNEVNGWALAQSNFNVQASRGWAAVQAGAIMIGTLLLPVLTHILTIIAPLIIAFASWAVSMMQNKTAMAIFAGVLAGLAAIILAVVVPAFIAWAAATIAATWPILLAGVIVAAVVFGVIMAIQHWGQIMTWLGNLVGTIGAWIGNVFSTMGTFIHGVLSAIGSWVGSIFSAIGTTIHNVFGAIGSFVGAVFSQIGTTIHGVWMGILGFLTGVWNVILAVAHVLFMLLVLYITWPFLIIWHFLGPHWNQILTFLTGIWNAIKNVAGTVFGAIGSFIGGVFSAIGTTARNVWNAIVSFLTGVWNAIKGVATTVWGAITTALGNFLALEWKGIQIVWNAVTGYLGAVWKNIQGMAGTIWNAILGVITGPMNTLKTVLSGIWTSITTAFTNAFNGLKGLAQGIWNGIVGVFKAGVNGLITAANWMIDRIDSISIDLPFGAGHIGFSIPHIPYIRSGIESFGGGMAYVHGGEVLTYLPRGSSVVPANRVTMMSGGGSGGAHGPVTLNVYVQQLDSREIDRVTGLLADRLRAQMGNI